MQLQAPRCPCLIPVLMRVRGPSGEPVVWLGCRWSMYLEFLRDALGQARCSPRPMTCGCVTVVAKTRAEVVPADVLGFITAQRAGVTSAGVFQSVEDPGHELGV